MVVRPGTSLGAYELLSLLGAGGMGEVYRARDTRLGREVALKIIQQRFADQPEHLARFRREAHALAALTHPNIAAVYELDEADGVVFIVMELVLGETLDEHLATGPLSIAEALRINAQIAAALEAAHEKGIIHRDLKPANIKITPEHIVKVLDFGLARMVGNGASASAFTHSPTKDTDPGAIVGTVGYMSPEQARGKPVDRRTDIWSFGCVLFMTLTNRRPFRGETVSDTIVNILEREPDWNELPGSTPAPIWRLLRRCLQKDLQRRLCDAGDARIELDEALSGFGTPAESGRSEAGTVTPRPRRLAVHHLVIVAVLAAALGFWIGVSQTAAPTLLRPPAHFVTSLPGAQRLVGLDFPSVAISPNGTDIAYVATRGGGAQLFLRALNALDAVPLPGASEAMSPFFSPDGRWIAFFADGKLKKMALSGGAPVTVCDAAVGFGGSWGPRDVIVFAPGTGSGLVSVPAAGGKPARATTLDAEKGEFSHRWPELLPDGDIVLFTVGTVGSWDDAQIVGQSLASGRRQLLVQGGTSPHFLKSGYLLYAHAGSVMAVRFDPKQLKTIGTAVRVLDNVLQSSDGAAQVSISQSAMIYVSRNPDAADRRLFDVDRKGAATPLAAPPRGYATPRLSPDGRKLLLTIAAATQDLWLYDIARGALQQLTFDADVTSPTWTPDGQRATFTWNKNGPPNLFSIGIAGGGSGERILSGERPQVAGAWSPDGRALAYVESDPETGRDIWMLPYAGDRKPRSFLKTMFDESAPRFAPDGRSIAYVSNESGRDEVYIAHLDDSSRRRQISNDGGTEPVWASNGRELFYRAGDRMMVAAMSAGAGGSSVPTRVLFEGKFEKGTLDVANYDVSADAQRFVMVQAVERDTAQQELHVLLNWTASLNAGTSPR